jgi:calcineurin-like phosphoesterase family protein
MIPKRKPIFFTSDLHVGHASVIEFDKRPFRDVDHMHEVLINNYNSTVPENGVCYFLGDMGLCKSSVLKEFMSKLNGSTKILILGNHDRNVYSMYDQGFDVVLNAGIFYIGDKRISISHCPLPGIFREYVEGMKGSQPGENWHGEFKQQRFMSQDQTVDFHLSGHIHSGPHCNKPVYTHNQYDVGVAGNRYRPVSISQIESWISVQSKLTKTE